MISQNLQSVADCMTDDLRYVYTVPVLRRRKQEALSTTAMLQRIEEPLESLQQNPKYVDQTIVWPGFTHQQKMKERKQRADNFKKTEDANAARKQDHEELLEYLKMKRSAHDAKSGLETADYFERQQPKKRVTHKRSNVEHRRSSKRRRQTVSYNEGNGDETSDDETEYEDHPEAKEGEQESSLPSTTPNFDPAKAKVVVPGLVSRSPHMAT